tara:strand:- start:3277 stop:5583 length:2307 start_codon:yes stop_codon:yes gene_type:complete
MAFSTSPDNLAVEYRYFVYDLLSDTLLAELPLQSVSYSRSLVEAGTFSGDVSVIPETANLDLYNNTLPGKRALYVLRNGVCIWGGIIWGRTYSLIDKVLSITAAEFPSYFAHRVVWKTWNSAYEASASTTSGVATVQLVGGQYDFQVGEAVWLDWGLDYAKYTGYFVVSTVALTEDGKSRITLPANYVDASGSTKIMPDLRMTTDNPITVETRQDTYQYAKDLLTELNTDLFDFDFANDEIRPGIDLFNDVASVSRDSNVATITLANRHELVAGQKVVVTDIQADVAFNASEAIVTEVITDYKFKYSNTGSDIADTAEVPFQYGVASFSRADNVATYNTSVVHGLTFGDVIFIENVSETFDGYFTVYEVPSNTSFKAVMYGDDIALSYTTPAQIAAVTNAIESSGTIIFTANNSFIPGVTVEISGVSPITYNGLYIVASATSTTFTVDGTADGAYSAGGSAETEPAYVTRKAAVTYGTFGEYTTKGDIGLDFTATDITSSDLASNAVVRGFQLRTVADVLDEYSTKTNGFEYRVDCEYDTASDTFKKHFKFLPLVPQALTTWLSEQESGFTGAIPASAYGADKFIFEYPGNILEADMEENAEDAATRVFVQGKDQYLSADASLPYSGAGNHLLLNDGWPILDIVSDIDSDDETVIYKHAARLLEESIPPISTFSISVNGSVYPKLGDYNPGDWCTVKLNDDFVSMRAASNLEQDYGTDDGALVRKIIAFDVTVPDAPSFPEQVKLELIIEPSVPISGVQIIDGKAFAG